MTYTVTWATDTLAELGRIAAAHSAPSAVADAAVRMDHALRHLPHDLGESRDPGERLWYADILGLYYRIDDDRSSVRILAVAPARR